MGNDYTRSGLTTVAVVNSPNYPITPEPMAPIRERKLSGLLLALGFCVAFSIPLLVVTLLHRDSSYRLNNLDNEKVWKADIPNPFKVNRSGQYLSIPNHFSLEPQLDKDFFLVTWMKLRSIPDSKDRSIFLLKYDGEAKARPGYGLALSGDGQTVHPEVYWRDEQGRGGWLTFPDIPVISDVWCMLALSFREGRYLGLHSALGIGEKPEVKLLGGYDLQGMSLPKSSNEMLIGAPQHSSFSGELGPVGIFSKPRLSASLIDLVKAFSRSPGELPTYIDKEDVGIWMGSGQIDEGPNKLAVTVIQPQRQ